MAIALEPNGISPPNAKAIVAPVLSALPAATVSTQPAPAILPFLSPILRQRVQLLSSSGTDPWIRLLSYDTSGVPKLTQAARSSELEPHPVSGEIEVDWDYETEVRYRRLDAETLQALVVLGQFDLFFRLVYCTGDKEGGGDGWRVGEVGAASDPSALSSFDGERTIHAAERRYESSRTAPQPPEASIDYAEPNKAAAGEEEADEDDYWARYDSSPSRTPAADASKPTQPTSAAPYESSSSSEDDYYARYDSVQPAMDNHDPDEQAAQDELSPPIGLAQKLPSNGAAQHSDLFDMPSGSAWTPDEPMGGTPPQHPLVHPRPSSDAGSSSSVSVARLEEAAERRDVGEFGVRQHVSRSIRNLFLLSRTAGIDAEEFSRIVRAELDVLSLVDDQI